MEDSVISMLINDAPASEISDKIKEILMQKSVERIESIRPGIVSQMFDLETETETEEE
jgi:hypothetical protein